MFHKEDEIDIKEFLKKAKLLTKAVNSVLSFDSSIWSVQIPSTHLRDLLKKLNTQIISLDQSHPKAPKVKNNILFQLEQGLAEVIKLYFPELKSLENLALQYQYRDAAINLSDVIAKKRSLSKKLIKLKEYLNLSDFTPEMILDALTNEDQELRLRLFSAIFKIFKRTGFLDGIYAKRPIVALPTIKANIVAITRKYEVECKVKTFMDQLKIIKENTVKCEKLSKTTRLKIQKDLQPIREELCRLHLMRLNEKDGEFNWQEKKTYRIKTSLFLGDEIEKILCKLTSEEWITALKIIQKYESIVTSYVQKEEIKKTHKFSALTEEERFCLEKLKRFIALTPEFIETWESKTNEDIETMLFKFEQHFKSYQYSQRNDEQLQFYYYLALYKEKSNIIAFLAIYHLIHAKDEEERNRAIYFLILTLTCGFSPHQLIKMIKAALGSRINKNIELVITQLETLEWAKFAIKLTEEHGDCYNIKSLASKFIMRPFEFYGEQNNKLKQLTKDYLKSLYKNTCNILLSLPNLPESIQNKNNTFSLAPFHVVIQQGFNTEIAYIGKILQITSEAVREFLSSGNYDSLFLLLATLDKEDDAALATALKNLENAYRIKRIEMFSGAAEKLPELISNYVAAHSPYTKFKPSILKIVLSENNFVENLHDRLLAYEFCQKANPNALCRVALTEKSEKKITQAVTNSRKTKKAEVPFENFVIQLVTLTTDLTSNLPATLEIAHEMEKSSLYKNIKKHNQAWWSGNREKLTHITKDSVTISNVRKNRDQLSLLEANEILGYVAVHASYLESETRINLLLFLGGAYANLVLKHYAFLKSGPSYLQLQANFSSLDLGNFSDLSVKLLTLALLEGASSETILKEISELSPEGADEDAESLKQKLRIGVFGQNPLTEIDIAINENKKSFEELKEMVLKKMPYLKTSKTIDEILVGDYERGVFSLNTYEKNKLATIYFALNGEAEAQYMLAQSYADFQLFSQDEEANRIAKSLEVFWFQEALKAQKQIQFKEIIGQLKYLKDQIDLALFNKEFSPSHYLSSKERFINFKLAEDIKNYPDTFSLHVIEYITQPEAGINKVLSDLNDQNIQNLSRIIDQLNKSYIEEMDSSFNSIINVYRNFAKKADHFSQALTDQLTDEEKELLKKVAKSMSLNAEHKEGSLFPELPALDRWDYFHLSKVNLELFPSFIEKLPAFMENLITVKAILADKINDLQEKENALVKTNSGVLLNAINDALAIYQKISLSKTKGLFDKFRTDAMKEKVEHINALKITLEKCETVEQVAQVKITWHSLLALALTDAKSFVDTQLVRLKLVVSEQDFPKYENRPRETLNELLVLLNEIQAKLDETFLKNRNIIANLGLKLPVPSDMAQALLDAEKLTQHPEIAIDTFKVMMARINRIIHANQEQEEKIKYAQLIEQMAAKIVDGTIDEKEEAEKLVKTTDENVSFSFVTDVKKQVEVLYHALLGDVLSQQNFIDQLFVRENRIKSSSDPHQKNLLRLGLHWLTQAALQGSLEAVNNLFIIYGLDIIGLDIKLEQKEKVVAQLKVSEDPEIKKAALHFIRLGGLTGKSVKARIIYNNEEFTFLDKRRIIEFDQHRRTLRLTDVADKLRVSGRPKDNKRSQDFSLELLEQQVDFLYKQLEAIIVHYENEYTQLSLLANDLESKQDDEPSDLLKELAENLTQLTVKRQALFLPKSNEEESLALLDKRARHYGYAVELLFFEVRARELIKKNISKEELTKLNNLIIQLNLTTMEEEHFCSGLSYTNFTHFLAKYTYSTLLESLVKLSDLDPFLFLDNKYHLFKEISFANFTKNHRDFFAEKINQLRIILLNGSTKQFIHNSDLSDLLTHPEQFLIKFGALITQENESQVIVCLLDIANIYDKHRQKALTEGYEFLKNSLQDLSNSYRGISLFLASELDGIKFNKDIFNKLKVTLNKLGLINEIPGEPSFCFTFNSKTLDAEVIEKNELNYSSLWSLISDMHGARDILRQNKNIKTHINDEQIKAAGKKLQDKIYVLIDIITSKLRIYEDFSYTDDDIKKSIKDLQMQWDELLSQIKMSDILAHVAFSQVVSSEKILNEAQEILDIVANTVHEKAPQIMASYTEKMDHHLVKLEALSYQTDDIRDELNKLPSEFSDKLCETYARKIKQLRIILVRQLATKIEKFKNDFSASSREIEQLSQSSSEAEQFFSDSLRVAKTQFEALWSFEIVHKKRLVKDIVEIKVLEDFLKDPNTKVEDFCDKYQALEKGVNAANEILTKALEQYQAKLALSEKNRQQFEQQKAALEKAALEKMQQAKQEKAQALLSDETTAYEKLAPLLQALADEESKKIIFSYQQVTMLEQIDEQIAKVREINREAEEVLRQASEKMSNTIQEYYDISGVDQAKEILAEKFYCAANELQDISVEALTDFSKNHAENFEAIIRASKEIEIENKKLKAKKIFNELYQPQLQKLQALNVSRKKLFADGVNNEIQIMQKKILFPEISDLKNVKVPEFTQIPHAQQLIILTETARIYEGKVEQLNLALIAEIKEKLTPLLQKYSDGIARAQGIELEEELKQLKELDDNILQIDDRHNITRNLHDICLALIAIDNAKFNLIYPNLLKTLTEAELAINQAIINYAAKVDASDLETLMQTEQKLEEQEKVLPDAYQQASYWDENAVAALKKEEAAPASETVKEKIARLNKRISEIPAKIEKAQAIPTGVLKTVEAVCSKANAKLAQLPEELTIEEIQTVVQEDTVMIAEFSHWQSVEKKWVIDYVGVNKALNKVAEENPAQLSIMIQTFNQQITLFAKKAKLVSLEKKVKSEIEIQKTAAAQVNLVDNVLAQTLEEEINEQVSQIPTSGTLDERIEILESIKQDATEQSKISNDTASDKIESWVEETFKERKTITPPLPVITLKDILPEKIVSENPDEKATATNVAQILLKQEVSQLPALVNSLEDKLVLKTHEHINEALVAANATLNQILLLLSNFNKTLAQEYDVQFKQHQVNLAAELEKDLTIVEKNALMIKAFELTHHGIKRVRAQLLLEAAQLDKEITLFVKLSLGFIEEGVSVDANTNAIAIKLAPFSSEMSQQEIIKTLEKFNDRVLYDTLETISGLPSVNPVLQKKLTDVRVEKATQAFHILASNIQNQIDCLIAVLPKASAEAQKFKQEIVDHEEALLSVADKLKYLDAVMDKWRERTIELQTEIAVNIETKLKDPLTAYEKATDFAKSEEIQAPGDVILKPDLLNNLTLNVKEINAITQKIAAVRDPALFAIAVKEVINYLTAQADEIKDTVIKQKITPAKDLLTKVKKAIEKLLDQAKDIDTLEATKARTNWVKLQKKDQGFTETTSSKDILLLVDEMNALQQDFIVIIELDEHTMSAPKINGFNETAQFYYDHIRILHAALDRLLRTEKPSENAWAYQAINKFKNKLKTHQPLWENTDNNAQNEFYEKLLKAPKIKPRLGGFAYFIKTWKVRFKSIFLKSLEKDADSLILQQHDLITKAQALIATSRDGLEGIFDVAEKSNQTLHNERKRNVVRTEQSLVQNVIESSQKAEAAEIPKPLAWLFEVFSIKVTKLREEKNNMLLFINNHPGELPGELGELSLYEPEKVQERYSALLHLTKEIDNLDNELKALQQIFNHQRGQRHFTFRFDAGLRQKLQTLEEKYVACKKAYDVFMPSKSESNLSMLFRTTNTP